MVATQIISFIFTRIPGEMIQFDVRRCFKWIETQPPTRKGFLIGEVIMWLLTWMAERPHPTDFPPILVAFWFREMGPRKFPGKSRFWWNVKYYSIWPDIYVYNMFAWCLLSKELIREAARGFDQHILFFSVVGKSLVVPYLDVHGS